jgi:hypothetical protein
LLATLYVVNISLGTLFLGTPIHGTTS